MKIAIQGHPTRGKEVIQLLKSLGGKSREELTGRRISQYYFINCNGDIDLNLRINLLNRKLYTLEEFEKEFPFKIGDMVVTATERIPRQIIAFEYYNDKLCYTLEDGFHYKPQLLELYKEMKEERNITLTLDKAKEWYKKGGELKEIALQAFTEKELNPLPRSWDEFCKQGNPIAPWRYSIPTKYEALYQLEQLRNCWRQGWKPNWNDDQQTKYCVIHYRGKFKISMLYETRHFLSFPTKEMAEEFFKCFRDLIEKAGDLI